MNRDGYRDQIVPHDVGVSLHSKTHPLFMKYSNGTSTVLCISLYELVSCAFSTIPICPFLIPGIFHLLVSNSNSSISTGYGPALYSRHQKNARFTKQNGPFVLVNRQ